MATDVKAVDEKIRAMRDAFARVKAWLTTADKPKGVDTPEQAVEYVISTLSAFRPLIDDSNSINNPFFYKAEKDGRIFFILGSNHYLLCSNLSDRVKDYAKTTKILIQERLPGKYVFLDKRKKIHLNSDVYQLGKELEPDKSPHHKLPEPVRSKLEEVFGKNLYKIKPWVLRFLEEEEGNIISKTISEISEEGDNREAADVVTVEADLDEIYEPIPVTERKEKFEELTTEEGISWLVQKNEGTEVGLEVRADVVQAQGQDKWTLEDDENNEDEPSNKEAEDSVEVTAQFIRLCDEFLVVYAKTDKSVDKLHQLADISALLDFAEGHELIFLLRNDAFNNSLKGAPIRNKKWVPKILDTVRTSRSSDPILMMVGAYHLLFGGEDSLLRLLEKEGFKITREIEDEKTKREDFLISYRAAEFVSTLWPGSLAASDKITQYFLDCLLSFNQAVKPKAVQQQAAVQAAEAGGSGAAAAVVSDAAAVRVAEVVVQTAVARVREPDPVMVLWGFNTHRRLKRLGIAAEFSEQNAGMAAVAKDDKLWTIALRGD